MKTCMSITMIERVAYKKVQGNDLEIEQKRHMESCDFCNDMFQALVEEYAEVERQLSSIPSAMVKSLVDSSLAEAIPQKFEHTARVVDFRSTISTSINSGWPHTRAADNAPALKTPRFENCGVLTTNDGDILIRIMRNNETKTFEFHLIAEDEEKYKNVPVHIEPLGVECLSDDSGIVQLEGIELPSPRELIITVSSQRALFDFNQMAPEWHELIGKGEIRLENDENEQLFVEFTPEGQAYQMTVRLEKAQLSDGSQWITVSANKAGIDQYAQPVQKGVAVFHEINEIPSLRIKIFG